MRHKQRPVKSSKHKSVTFIIDGHTSFGDGSANNDSHHHPHVKPTFSSQQIPSTAPSTSMRTPTSHQHLQRPQRSTAINNTSSYQHSGSGPSTSISLYTPTQSSRSIIATNDDDRHNHDNPLMRKQFEHNFSHMDTVMRLAFLENNDISIEDSSNYDFNSLSTASILQRNIQQQLQQERREQLQLRNQQHQLHQQRQQQRQQHNQQHQQQLRNNRYQQQQQQQQHLLLEQQDYEEEDLVDEDYDEEYEDYEISDSRIFATASSTSSQPNYYQRTPVSVGSSKNVHMPSSSGGISHSNFAISQAGSGHNINARNMATLASPSAKRRARDLTPRVEFSNQIQVETIQNYAEGFFCDEAGCGKSFPSLRKLRHHKVVHSDEFPFVCEFKGCAKKFKRKFGIDLHSTTHFDLDPGMYSKTSNNSSLPFFGRRMQYSMCKPCGQKFKTVHEYQYHMLKHGKEPFKCPVKGCGQTFGIWKSFQKHRASHYFNYYCKMDPGCDHHTSNLQLLKLHIYCCHFRRKLPENATLSSKDAHELDEPASTAEPIDAVDTEDQSQIQDQQEDDYDDSQPTVVDSPPREPTPPPPRRDSRLRKNPPRSSTFGHQDYASINNGSSFTKAVPSSPQTKRTRSAVKQEQSQEIVDNYNADNDESYEISDSGIFATATPASSSGKSLICSTPKEPQRLNNSNGKKRLRETTPEPDIESPVKQEVIPNYSEGFFCDEAGCGKSFPSLRKLRHHKVVHSDEFPFVCEFKGCAKKFKRKFGIDLHSTTHFDLDPGMYSKTSNNSSLPFFGRRMQYSMCKPCGQKFKTVHEYQYHMLKHGKEPFKCPVKGCGQTFGIWKSFQKHRASHYFNYYCKMDPGCDHHTSNLQLLKLHIYCCHFRRKLPEDATLSSKDVHELDEPTTAAELIDVVDTEDQSQIQDQQEDDYDDLQPTVVDSPPKEPTPPPPRRDSRLRKNPPRSSTFGHQDYASINNGSSFTKAVPSSPQTKRTRSAVKQEQSQEVVDNYNADNDFKCHLCDYKFSVRFQLTKHLSTHLELTPEMYSKTADKQVVQLSERRRREFFCEKCRVKFEQMTDLDDHMQKKHGQRPYVCTFCQVPSSFSIAKQYLSHLYEHRFNYKCTMAPGCDFTINRKDALKLHIFRMHLNQQLPSYIENFANYIG